MNAATCKGLFTESWKDLYQAAIRESDLTKLPERIADAETALVMRARDLFYASGDKIDEKESFGRGDVHPSCPPWFSEAQADCRSTKRGC
jgi:hypothetical protein